MDKFNCSGQIIGHNLKCAKEAELSIIKNDIKKLQQPAVLTDDITVTNKVGGADVGKVFHKGTTLESVLKTVLAPDVPIITGKIYYGCFDEVPATIGTGWTEEDLPSGMATTGKIIYFTTNNFQYECFAFPKQIGEIKHIYQNDLVMFDLINDFSKVIVIKNGVEYYLYYGTEQAKETNAKYQFLWQN